MRVQYLIIFFLLITSLNACQIEQRQEIIILDSYLAKIPDTVFGKKDLTTLVIAQKGFTIYPPLSALPIDTFKMPLREIPEQLGSLTNLKFLQISGSRIEKLPNSIVKLRKLDSLDLSLNPYLDINKEIEKLKQLPNLRYLNIYGSKVPEEDMEAIKSSFRNRVKVIITLPEFLKTLE